MWRVICVLLQMYAVISADTHGCRLRYWNDFTDRNSYGSRYQNYRRNLDGTCAVSAPGNKVVGLYIFHRAVLQDSGNCNSNNLTIYDGPDISSPVIKTLCAGQRGTTVIYSTGQSVSLRFSDGSMTERRFRIYYKFIDKDRTCPTRPQYLRGQSGIIRSHPAAGYKMYYGGLDCKWIIDVGPRGSSVLLQFDYFNLEGRSESRCKYSSLTVYKGGDVNSERISTLCGSNLPSRIVSIGQRLMLRFRTDSYPRFKGFKLRFQLRK